jgi:hypothetical protein
MSIVYEKGTKSVDHRYRSLYISNTGTDMFWSHFMEEHINVQLFPANIAKTLKNDFVIIGGNKETIIAMKKLPIAVHGNIIAILDSSQPNRVFVGHVLEPGGNVHDGLVHFDDKGNQHGTIKVFQDCLFRSYYRYGHPQTWDEWKTPFQIKSTWCFVVILLFIFIMTVI